MTTDQGLITNDQSAELAGGFIHEIKNHLNTLSLNLQLLAEDFEDARTPRERKALERVTKLSDECRRLAELSNDFLRFARLDDLHCEETNLDEVVTRMLDFLGPTARAQGITINWYPAPDLPALRVDK
jgi:signal transduction histidine kinase